jgi:hypothetical protein
MLRHSASHFPPLKSGRSLVAQRVEIPSDAFAVHPKHRIARVGQNHKYTVHIRYFCREITKYTVIYGVYIRFWPTLRIAHKGHPAVVLPSFIFNNTHSHRHTFLDASFQTTHTVTGTHPFLDAPCSCRLIRIPVQRTWTTQQAPYKLSSGTYFASYFPLFALCCPNFASHFPLSA